MGSDLLNPLRAAKFFMITSPKMRFDLDLFWRVFAILVCMDESKACINCKRPVTGKRKDAIYCSDPQCRKDAYLKRKEQAAQVPLALSANKSSLVVTFPDGRRCLIELTLLEAVAPAPSPTLTQIPNLSTENGSGSSPAQADADAMLAGSIGITTEQIPPTSTQPTALSSSTKNDSDQIQHAGTESLPTSAPHIEKKSDQTAPLSASTSADIGVVAATPSATNDRAAAPSALEPRLRTVELFFRDDMGGELTFQNAVRSRPDNSWRLRRYAKAMLGFSRSEGHGLGGTPGTWRDFYPGQSPSAFGLDSDIAVLYRDAEAGRVYAALPELLREMFGPRWREQVRQFADRTPTGLRR